MASAGLLFSYLLALRLCRATVPAIVATLFLVASPIFFSQSEMILLDMPAMTFTALALLLFLDERYAACAAACTALVLMKETSITTPMVFGAWLLFREKKIRQALYFFAPAAALGAWLVLLHSKTGYWLGNEEFARYNVDECAEFSAYPAGFWRAPSLPVHRRRAFFGRDCAGRRISVAARKRLDDRRTDGRSAGGRRYGVWRRDAGTLPDSGAADPLCGDCLGGRGVSRMRWRWISHAAMIAMLVAGWFWNPPYPFSYENNLAWTDFVELQKDAAKYLEANAPDKRILSSWPFTGRGQASLSWLRRAGR